MSKDTRHNSAATVRHSELNRLSELSQTIQTDKQPEPATVSEALLPLLRYLITADDADLTRRVRLGNPADFAALTLHRTPTSVLRLHFYAPGASDCDPHMHKGPVRSRLLTGAMTNHAVTPLFLPEGQGNLNVWECGSPGGVHSRVRAPLSAVIDADAIVSSIFLPGESFTVPAGGFHTVADAGGPGELTSTLCQFEFDDSCAQEPYVLTAKEEPLVPERTITIAHIRSAMSSLLMNGIT